MLLRPIYGCAARPNSGLLAVSDKGFDPVRRPVGWGPWDRPEEWHWGGQPELPKHVPVPAPASIYHQHVWTWGSDHTSGLVPLYATCSCDLTYERYLRLLAGERGLLV